MGCRSRALPLALAVFFLVTAPARPEEAIFGDGFELAGTCAWTATTGQATPVRSFCVSTPTIAVAASEHVATCYYFRTANTQTIGAFRFASSMPEWVVRAVLMATREPDGDPIDRKPPGTLSTEDCGIGSGSVIASWIYDAHAPASEMVLPADDGNGDPLAFEIPADLPVFLYLEVANPSDSTVSGRVLLGASALSTGTTYARTETYLNYNSQISIAPGSSNQSFSESCAVPDGVEFWRLTTRTHRFATEAEIRDGATTLLTITDWTAPEPAVFEPPTYTFASDALTWECTYANPTGATVSAGNSVTADEECVAVGWFHPATEPYLCIDGLGPL